MRNFVFIFKETDIQYNTMHNTEKKNDNDVSYELSMMKIITLTWHGIISIFYFTVETKGSRRNG